MTGSVLEVYETGLSARQLWAHEQSGRWFEVPVADWCQPLLDGDRGLLGRCSNLTLDVGCGPGRLTAALNKRSMTALGIDLSPGAVRQAKAAGAAALVRSVFGAVPHAGTWSTVLLADGNIGIGGRPAALLARAGELLSPTGAVLAELEAPGERSRRTKMRLHDMTGRSSEWFAWAYVGVDAIEPLARQCGYDVNEVWQEAGRWFTRLVRRSSPGSVHFGVGHRVDNHRVIDGRQRFGVQRQGAENFGPHDFARS